MYYIWPFDGSLTAHPNSLLFNAVPLYWPFKAFWFFRKFGEIVTLQDFPKPAEDHPDFQRPRKYFSLSFKH